MPIPARFVEQLETLFGGRYRIRWSDARGSYQLEQRVGPGFHPGSILISPRNARQWREKWDDMQRAQDGYVLTLEITPGDRIGCPTCRQSLPVPIRSLGHVICGWCRLHGNRVHPITVGYWPLDDDLLHYLKKIDAYSGGIDRVAAEVNAANQQQEHDALMRWKRPGEAALHQEGNRLLGIPQWGRTGNENSWADAPASKY